MRKTWSVLVMATLMLGAVPTGSSQPSQADCASATPPCGWINPQLYLDMPGTASCSLSIVRSEDPDLSGCPAPPTDGSPIVMQGEFRLTWDVSEEGAYMNDPDDPIEVTFRATSSNPSFVDFSLEPSTFTLDSATLYDPQNYVTKQNEDGSESIWYEYIRPITVTFTRTGDPSAEDIERIQNKDGLVQVFIRIHSDPSGSTYRDSYGMEAFNFHLFNAEDDPVLQEIDYGQSGRGVPAPSSVWMALALLAAALMGRRR